MHKRGQFFLIAALITASLLFGLTTVANSARGSEPREDFYDLSQEIDFETKRVLDYGVYYERDTATLMRTFLSTYADYIAQEKVIFLFGNAEELEGLYFRNRAIGSTGIATGGRAQTVVIREVTGSVADIRHEGDSIIVTIDSIPYTFSLLEGQNFFFVIIQEENEESYVATN